MEKKQLIYISLGVGVLILIIIGFILYRKNEQYTPPTTPIGSFRVDSNGNLSISPGLPIGSIVMWNSNSPPPKGWAICDGTNGTPDLQGRFPRGVTNPTGLNPDFPKTGGNTNITLSTQNIPAHSHNISMYASQDSSIGGGNNTFRAGQTVKSRTGVYQKLMSEDDGGNNMPISIMPPYYAISFIMKIN